MIAGTAVAIVLNAPERLATAVPGYTQSLQEHIEGNTRASRELEALRARGRSRTTLGGPGAPEIAGIKFWMNTPSGSR